VPAPDAEPTSPPSPDGRRGPAHRFLDRFGGIVRELGKFGTVGGTAFLIDLTIFNVLLGTGSETLVAKTISTVIATTVAFLGNRFWTWRHRERRNLAREYTLFFALNAVGLGIGLACLAISHYGLGAIWPVFTSQLADNVSGLLIGTALGTLFRFWSYRRFVFPDTAVPDTAIPDTAVPDTAIPDSAVRGRTPAEPPGPIPDRSDPAPAGPTEHRPAM
jgi:putative flippase GtrA